jgi:hypothetical protein
MTGGKTTPYYTASHHRQRFTVWPQRKQRCKPNPAKGVTGKAHPTGLIERPA